MIKISYRDIVVHGEARYTVTEDGKIVFVDNGDRLSKTGYRTSGRKSRSGESLRTQQSVNSEKRQGIRRKDKWTLSNGSMCWIF